MTFEQWASNAVQHICIQFVCFFIFAKDLKIQRTVFFYIYAIITFVKCPLIEWNSLFPGIYVIVYTQAILIFMFNFLNIVEKTCTPQQNGALSYFNERIIMYISRIIDMVGKKDHKNFKSPSIKLWKVDKAQNSFFN